MELGDSRSYPIVFSPIASLGDALEDFHFAKTSKCVLVSNDVVGKTKHKQVAIDALKNAGWNVSYVEFPDGELKKTRTSDIIGRDEGKQLTLKLTVSQLRLTWRSLASF